MSWSSVQTAEAAEADYAAAVHAANVAIGNANSALGELLAPSEGTASAAIGALLHTLAIERARIMAAGAEPALPGGPSGAHGLLYGRLRWPAIAYRPATVDPLGNVKPWWPLGLGTAQTSEAWGTHSNERTDWLEWAWARLAMRKARGFSIDPAGVLHFRDTWRTPGPVPPGGFESGQLVMVGTGPHGEQGVSVQDMRAGRAARRLGA